MCRRSCEQIVLNAVDVVQEDVFKFLRCPKYGNRDSSKLTLLPRTVVTKGPGSAISVTHTDNSKHLNKYIEKKTLFFSDSVRLDVDIDQNIYLHFQQEMGMIC